MGRQTEYTEEIAEQICELIATSSKGLNVICRETENLPAPSTVYKWLSEQPEFSERYARAREIQADLLADEIIEIADDTSNDTLVSDTGEYANKEWINRSRLRVDARKWKASKLAPKKYGDKVDVTSNGEAVKQVFQINGVDIEF